MKKTIFISALSSLALLFISFNHNKSEELYEQIMTLNEAVNNKIITVSFISNGKYSGKSIVCRLVNLKGRSYKIKVPEGTYFQAPNEGEQDLIIPQEDIITLKEHEKKSVTLDGFCTNLKNSVPSIDGEFKLIPSKISKNMTLLLTFLKNKKIESGAIQDAIWVITNNTSVSDIYGSNKTSIDALRKELCAITGQNPTWYSSPQQITIREDGSINRETASIDGQLEYLTKKGAKLHTEVHNPKGETIIKTKESISAFAGSATYHFQMKVQGWKKGKYLIKVVEDSIILKTYEFNV